MTYQVLARKWRPQDFSSLVGQEHVVTALRNALADRRIAQAYLFSGIRGVGKTTAARLLAKALNCEQGPTPEPCNRCTPCREITAGSDLDVLEVDAATYSKVEQVRELTESLRYGAARDRYKVVVLDEIHRLSRQAFDALLKIVEEPPPHLVFVFATTESEAVPATILSRCQEFHFRRVASDVLARYLRGICEHEEIETSDAALRMIARAGEGSVRDSVALLDQLATFGGGTIADEDAARLLGGLDAALLHDLLAALLAGDGAAVTAIAANLEDEGRDPRHVFSQFLSYCRNALHFALGATGTGAGRVDLPEEEAEALAELAGAAGYENLLRLVQQLLTAEPMVRRSENGYLAAEIAWLRAAELPKLVRVEELLGGTAGGGGEPKTLSVPRRSAAGGGGRQAAGAAGAGRGAAAPENGAAKGGAERQEAAGRPRPAATPNATPGAAADGRDEEGSDDGLSSGRDGSERPGNEARVSKGRGSERRDVEGAGDDGRSATNGNAAPRPASASQPAAGPGAGGAATGRSAVRPSAEPAFADRLAEEPEHVRAQSGDPGFERAGDAHPGPVSSSSASAGSVAAFLDEVRRAKQPLAAYLDHAELAVEAGALVIRHDAGDEVLRSRLDNPANREILDDAVRRTWGSGACWTARAARLAAAAGPSEEEEAATGADEAQAGPEVLEHPTVQTVLELFGGTISTVEERDD